MISNEIKERFQLTPKEVEKFSKFLKGRELQEVDDFIKDHPELPKDHFATSSVGRDVSPYLIVKGTKASFKALPLIAKAIRGTCEDGNVEYIYFVDVDEYKAKQQDNFKTMPTILKNRNNDNYHLKGATAIKFYKVERPRYFWDVEF